MTTEPNDEALLTLLGEVQRLLGRCLLRLQQYEQLIKAIAAHHEIAGPVPDLESIRAKRLADTADKTLGTLVGQILGSYIVDRNDNTAYQSTSIVPADTACFAMRMQLSMSAEDYGRTERSLKELVLLRNNLIHHFLDEHDLRNLGGRQKAHDALVDAFSRIDQEYIRLRGWAEEMESTRQRMVAFTQSDTFTDLVVNGIAPDGTVDWHVAAIVDALREAALALSIDGWTPVVRAERWIADRHPEQFPAKYGCSSWRQVVQESRQFELRYFKVGGRRVACYRPKGT